MPPSDIRHRRPTGLEPCLVRREITRLRQTAANGNELVAEIVRVGFRVLRNSRNVLVVVDPLGGEHRLQDRIAAPPSDVRALLAEIDLTTVPRKKLRQRPVRASFRLTAEESKRLDQEALHAGITRSELLRQRSLGKTSTRPRSVRKALPEEVALIRLRGELGKVGSNLNQIARGLNQGHFDPNLAAAVMGALQALIPLEAAIRELLQTSLPARPRAPRLRAGEKTVP